MKILILSGKKQSGKDSAVKFLNNQNIRVKKFSFAEELKSFLVRVMGLKEEQVNGTDAEKDSLTHLMWENMPGVMTPISMELFFEEHPYMGGSDIITPFLEEHGIKFHEPGPMTGREAMQYFGSDICRRMYSDCWVRNTWTRIQEWYNEHNEVLFKIGDEVKNWGFQDGIITLTDCRFPNEVSYLSERGAKSIRFLRQISDDSHISETALDGYAGFDYIIDNREMTLEEQNSKILGVLQELNWIN